MGSNDDITTTDQALAWCRDNCVDIRCDRHGGNRVFLIYQEIKPRNGWLGHGPTLLRAVQHVIERERGIIR